MKPILSSDSSKPPISTLNDDVLLELFTFVVFGNFEGRMEDYRDILSISQVCRRWRRIVLDAPSLWTQINLCALVVKSNNWREDVLRRTKQSPLELYGDQFNYPGILPFCNSVLSAQWPRIRKVDLDFSRSDFRSDASANAEFDELCRIFSQPAPKLSSFSVWFSDDRNGPPYWDSQLFKPHSVPLFPRREAPFLSFFHSNLFCPSLDTRWSFNRLTNLSILFPPTVQEFFELLASTPSLVELHLKCPNRNSIATPPPQSLPYVAPFHLKYISIRIHRRSVQTFIRILDHIQPRQRFALLFYCTIRTLRRLIPVDISDTEAYQRVLKTFTTSAFSNTIQDPLATTIRVSVKRFDIRTRPHWPDSRSEELPYNCLFIFSVDFTSNDSLSDTGISGLLQLLGSCDFSPIRALTLTGDSRFASYTDVDQRTRFYRRFSSVERLTVQNMDVLRQFTDLDLSAVFPRLELLVFLWMPTYQDSTEILAVMKNWTPGSASKSLKLVHVFGRNEVNGLSGVDFSYLDEIIGLRITWNIGGDDYEYTCGTGNAEVIDFSSQPPPISGIRVIPRRSA